MLIHNKQEAVNFIVDTYGFSSDKIVITSCQMNDRGWCDNVSFSVCGFDYNLTYRAQDGCYFLSFDD